MLLFWGVSAVLTAAEPVLKVVALEKTLAFSSEEFAALPYAEITAFDRYERKDLSSIGVTIHGLLLHAGAPLGEKLRGSVLQRLVIARTRGRFAVAFALADFDEASGNRTILLVEKEEGQPLLENGAPYRRGRIWRQEGCVLGEDGHAS